MTQPILYSNSAISIPDDGYGYAQPYVVQAGALTRHTVRVMFPQIAMRFSVDEDIAKFFSIKKLQFGVFMVFVGNFPGTAFPWLPPPKYEQEATDDVRPFRNLPEYLLQPALDITVEVVNKDSHPHVFGAVIYTHTPKGY